MKGGPKPSLRPFLHRALQFFRHLTLPEMKETCFVRCNFS